jgi:hypothetical protein
MLICKIFSGNVSSKVEEEVNAFLDKSPQIAVHFIGQSSDSQRVFISIFFNVKTQSSIRDAAEVEQVESIVAKAELK